MTNSGVTVQASVAIALAGLVACESSFDLAPDGALSLAIVGTENLAADGASKFRLAVEVKGNRSQKLQYSLSDGHFLLTAAKKEITRFTAPQDAKTGVDTVVVVVGRQPGRLGILVTAGNVQRSVSVQVDTAYAEKIRGESSLFFLPVDGKTSTTLTALLSRSQGLVGDGIEVNFRAFQVDGPDTVPVGRFSGRATVRTDSKESASIKMLLADTTMLNRDTVFVQMSTVGASGDLVELPVDSLVRVVPRRPS